MCHCRHVRDRFAGVGIFAAVAGVLCAIGVLAVLLELQSPSLVMWTGIKVRGTTQSGLTYYSYQGQNYSIDNPHAAANDPSEVPTTVWLSQSDPTDSTKTYIENVYTRWIDFGFVTGWFFAAAVLLAAGFIRRHLRLHRRVQSMGQFGAGLSDDVVRRLLTERKGDVPRVQVNLDE